MLTLCSAFTLCAALLFSIDLNQNGYMVNAANFEFEFHKWYGMDLGESRHVSNGQSIYLEHLPQKTCIYFNQNQKNCSKNETGLVSLIVIVSHAFLQASIKGRLIWKKMRLRVDRFCSIHPKKKTFPTRQKLLNRAFQQYFLDIYFFSFSKKIPTKTRKKILALNVKILALLRITMIFV